MSAEGDAARDWAEEVGEMNAPVSSADRRILTNLLRELADIADAFAALNREPGGLRILGKVRPEPVEDDDHEPGGSS